MPTYLHPGVYIEEIPSGAKPIEGVGTSTACFLGYTNQGPVGEPRLIFRFDDYLRLYGGIRDTGTAQGDAMGFSVAAFFQNGGSKAYIVRLAKNGTTPATALKKATAQLNHASLDTGKILEFTAVNEGKWADGVVIKLTPSASGFIVEIGRNKDGNLVPSETFKGASLKATDPRFIGGLLAGVSRFVSAELKTAPATPPAVSLDATLAGGGDGTLPDNADYSAALEKLVKIRDINILCLPGKSYNPAGKPEIELAIAHAEATANRMVIVDPPPGTELVTEASVVNLGLPTSTYSALYYPWVEVVNPFYNADTKPGAPVTVLVPPCGFAAGMWAKIDGRRGVWKAPAGVETQLLGVADLEYQVEELEQDQLNPLGVNALRKLPGFGQVVWGARTLSTRANPEWRYVPVRRTAMLIEQSIYNGIQWAVFEPNDHKLWSSLRTNIDTFMNGLFRAGAFQGQKASDAYFVRCGLGDTMTQGEIDAGQVIVVVGFAPLKPAEFVIVRIQQKVAQQ